MSPKAARTLVLRRSAAALPRVRVVTTARLLAALVVAALLAPAAVSAIDPTTSTLVSSAPSVLKGTPVTYTTSVVVPGSASAPTGTVTVQSGATTLGTCPLVNGACSVVSGVLPVGTHAITASYSGDATRDPSTSGVLIQTVTMGVRAARAVGTTVSSGQTSLAVAPPVGATTGDTLIAAVTVTGGGATTITATGWTRLFGSDISSGTLLRQGLFQRTRLATDPTTYTFGFSSAQRASAIVVAVAGADGATARSIGAVYPSGTTFTLPSLGFGAPTTGVALGFLGVGVGTTITSVGGGYASIASVAATGGKAASQTTSGSGQLTLLDASSAAGARFTVGAAGVGIGHTVIVTRPPAATVTRIVTSTAIATYGTATTWTARVDPTSATGRITFLADGSTGVGSCTPTGGICSASLALPAGKRNVSARFQPITASLQASTSTPVAVSVARASSTTTLIQLASSSTRGTAAAFRISVVGGLSATSGTGTVTLLDGGEPVATCGLATGTCDATTATLAVGSHAVTARFDGDGSLEPSDSLGVLHTVTRASSATVLSVPSGQPAYGSSVALTATVTSPFGTPTGAVDFFEATTFVGTCLLGSGGTPGTCTRSVQGLAIGARSLTASYVGDTDRSSSTSSARALTIAPATAAVSVSGSPALVLVGGSVTLTASVTTGDGSPATGSITFTEGTLVLGSCTLGTPAAGSCSVAVSNLVAGTHEIGAAYGGDTLRQPASTTYLQAIGRATSTTTITSSSNPAIYGTPLTFTVSVTSGYGTPTGTVSVSDGTAPLGSCTLTAGSCTVPVATLAGGSRSISAAYPGDTSREPSTRTVMQSITAAPTSTTIGATGTLSFGGPVMLTAIVDRSAATGTVSFSDGTSSLGTCTLGSGGIAGRCAIMTTSLSVGTRSLVARYLGDGNFAASTSSAAAVTIERAATSLALVAIGGATYGSLLTLTATLDRTSASGTISFSDGTTGIGSCSVGTLAPGSCALQIATLGAGVHSLTARYEGTGSFLPASSDPLALAIAVGSSTTSLELDRSIAGIDQAVLLTASVGPAGATGFVDFLEGTTWLGSCNLVSGSCGLPISFAEKGVKQVIASYRGDANLGASVSAWTSLVVRSGSTTTLVSDTTTATFGSPLTLTATVAGADGGVPTGRISFSDGTRPLGGCDLAGAAPASCSITVNFLDVGLRTLVARYAGDADYAPSTGSVPLAIVEATSSTTVTTSGATVVALTPVSFTVVVRTGDGSLPVGAVAISDGTTPLGPCPLVAGTCTFTTDQLGVGARTIVATFAGDANHLGSVGSVAQTVTAIASSVTATGTPSPVAWGSAVVLSATVRPIGATGTVTFVESGTTYGTCPISITTGTCVATTSALPVGTRTITVRYSGDARYAGSNSAVVVTVTRAPSSTTLVTSAATATFGTSLTFTASVAPASATGTVSFSDGTTGIGSCTLASGSCSISTATLVPGTRTIVARYGGSTTLEPSASSPLAQSIVAAPTTMTLASSGATSTLGSGSLTITVAPTGATGSVSVTDNGAPFASCVLAGGTCTIGLAALALGSHTLVASYPGSTTYEATSATIVQVVSVGYRAVAAVSSAAQTPTSLGVVIPATVTTGDVLVAAVTIGSGSATITPASGWTRLGSDLTSGVITQGIFWRSASAGDVGATSAFGFSTGVKASIVLVAVGGASGSIPGAGTFGGQANGVATSIAVPGLTLPASGRGIAIAFGGMATGTTIASVGAGYLLPSGGEVASSGGKSQTTTVAAISTPGVYASVATTQFATPLTTGATSIGHVVFLSQR